MKNLKWLVIFKLCLVCSTIFAQGLSSIELERIEYLKSELKNSNCSFERNSKRYGAEKAVKHISRKQAHFEDDIDSVVKFIELTATQSSMSGKPYYIICGDSRVESAVWLKNKLSQAQK